MNSLLVKISSQRKSLLILLGVGVLLRLLPIWLWGAKGCVRDECTYLKQAFFWFRGDGIVASSGWLWAPGYSFFLVVHRVVFQSIFIAKYSQIAISAVVAVLLYSLSKDHKRGMWVVALYMLSPTQIFFAQSFWSETIYGFLLVLLVWLFHTKSHWAWIGLGFGCAILTRGSALFLLPLCVYFFWREKRPFGGIVLIVFLMIAPYSFYASNKFERFIVVDRTFGRMMWLGNNDFPPMTFDWGNGVLSSQAFARYREKDVYHCPQKPKKTTIDMKNRWSMELQDCLTETGVGWLAENPKELVLRVPLRMAQLFNPHSFLTRHLRSGKWRGLSVWMDEFLILWGALWTIMVLWGGLLGLITNRKNQTAQFSIQIIGYHMLVIALLAGLSRYRVPLEPLFMLYAGDVLGGGQVSLDSRSKGIIALCFLFFVPISLWFFPSGWSWWRTYH